MKKYAAEAIGTFWLLFAGTGAIIVDAQSLGVVSHTGIALTFGLTVMAMIYSIGDISGAHINPAVTVAFWAARRLPGRLVVPYVVAQCVGAVAASGLLALLFPDHGTLGATLPAGPWHQSLVFEVLITCLLMFVILNVSVGAKEKGIMAGAAIGGTVTLAALFAGPVSGASMNPARSLGPAVVGGNLHHFWIYVAGPLLGALLAVPACGCVQGAGCCSAGPTPADDSSPGA